MNTELLNKISDKKLARITTREIDEAAQALPAAVDEIEAMPSAEEKIAALNLRFGFLKNSLLHLTAKFADAASTEKILKIAEGNSEIVNARNEGLFTPLHFAAHSGDPMVAQLLIDAGAERSPQASAENRRWTPVHYAAQFGHDGVVEVLINSGVDKETPTDFGLTPLVVGAEFGQIRVVELMLQIGANKNAKTIAENHCMNALHYAAVGDFRDVAFILLKAGIDRNYKTDSGLTALDLAIQSDRPNMAALLLSWGIGDIDEAYKLATDSKCTECITRIKDYVDAKKNLFNPGWLQNFAPELIATLKKCSRENLGEIVISPASTVELNPYGILALKRQTGFFSKKDEGFQQFCANNGMTDVVNVLRAVEQMMPKN